MSESGIVRRRVGKYVLVFAPEVKGEGLGNAREKRSIPTTSQVRLRGGRG